MKIQLKTYVENPKEYIMKIPEEDEKLITGDDIDWIETRFRLFMGASIYSGRIPKHVILQNLFNVIFKDIDEGVATSVEILGCKSWFQVTRDYKLSSVFQKIMKEWYEARFQNEKLDIILYNEMVHGLGTIYEKLHTLDHRYDNWGYDANGAPVCIDFDGDELDVIKLEEGDTES